PPIGQAMRLHLRALSPGERYVLRFARNGEPREVTLAVTTTPASLASKLIYLVVSLVWCVVGLFIGSLRPAQPVARLACLAAATSGEIYLNVGILQAGLGLQPLHSVLGLHFFCRFPDGATVRGWWRVLLGMLYVAVGASVGLTLWFSGTLLVRGAAAVHPYA